MRKTVLVVEDDEILRLLICEAIDALGLDALESESADEAHRVLRFRASSIDMVITDVRMPGEMDGLALARVVWASWPRIPVVVTSGNLAVQFDRHPENAFFLPKPWTLESLHSLIFSQLKLEG